MEIKDKSTASHYYDYRKEIQELYKHDTYYGDLAGEVLKYRDEHKFIESISIDMSIPKIEIEYSDKKQMNKIIQDIRDIITGYIISAAPQLNLDKETLKGLNEFVSTYSLFETYYIGNTITFNL